MAGRVDGGSRTSLRGESNGADLGDAMPGYPRAELEEMVARWLAANERAEQTGDWATHLGPFYTDDAEYTWNVGPEQEFVARGPKQIREWALGIQMEGFEQWQYPYDKILIDHVQGEVVGFWRQVSPFQRRNGTTYDVAGVGGSWFEYAGAYRWSRQRDFFDFGNVMSVFLELAADGHLDPAVKRKVRQMAWGRLLAGHVRLDTGLTRLRKLKGYLAMARIALIGR